MRFAAGDFVNIDARARMRFICCTILVLSALLLILSLDQRPDPPATIPHTASVKSLDLRDCPNVFSKQHLSCNYAGSSSHLQVCSIALAADARPNRPSDWIALTGHAADPSPPAV